MRALVLLLPFLLAVKGRSPVLFYGVDYTLARFYATDDFNDAGGIFPGYLHTWNQMWIDEVMEDMQRQVGPVTVRNDVTWKRNKSADARQIVREDGPASWV